MPVHRLKLPKLNLILCQKLSSDVKVDLCMLRTTQNQHVRNRRPRCVVGTPLTICIASCTHRTECIALFPDWFLFLFRFLVLVLVLVLGLV